MSADQVDATLTVVTDPTTAQTMNAHLSESVARLRKERRLAYTELSERLSELGQPIPVLGLRRIEQGKRRVDIDEIAALAKALEVPPLWLFLPVGQVAKVEVLPGYVRDTWDAAKWFTGEAPLSTEPQYDERGVFHAFTQSSADFNAWQAGGRPLERAREHERLLMSWRIATMHAMGDLAEWRKVESIPGKGPIPGGANLGDLGDHLREIANEGVREARALEKALLDHRRAMEREGMVLPEVPELQPERRQALAEFGLAGPTAKSAPVDDDWIDGSEETDG